MDSFAHWNMGMRLEKTTDFLFKVKSWRKSKPFFIFQQWQSKLLTWWLFIQITEIWIYDLVKNFYKGISI